MAVEAVQPHLPVMAVLCMYTPSMAQQCWDTNKHEHPNSLVIFKRLQTQSRPYGLHFWDIKERCTRGAMSVPIADVPQFNSAFQIAAGNAINAVNANQAAAQQGGSQAAAAGAAGNGAGDADVQADAQAGAEHAAPPVIADMIDINDDAVIMDGAAGPGASLEEQRLESRSAMPLVLAAAELLGGWWTGAAEVDGGVGKQAALAAIRERLGDDVAACVDGITRCVD